MTQGCQCHDLPDPNPNTTFNEHRLHRVRRLRHGTDFGVTILNIALTSLAIHVYGHGLLFATATVTLTIVIINVLYAVYHAYSTRTEYIMASFARRLDRYFQTVDAVSDPDEPR